MSLIETKRAAQLWASSAADSKLRLANSHLLGPIYGLPILAESLVAEASDTSRGPAHCSGRRAGPAPITRKQLASAF
jgi:hypothetical protein